MSEQWKCGDEFLPYHPQASHVAPDYRDGWNACYRAAMGGQFKSGGVVFQVTESPLVPADEVHFRSPDGRLIARIVGIGR